MTYTYETYEVLENSINIFENIFALGIIGLLNFIFTICAMFVINQDAKKRKIKCWHWNLILFLTYPACLSFIVAILYIIFACGNNPIIENDTIIDTRSNDNSNNQNINNNVNLPKAKTKSYPKSLIFYSIIQLVSLCISFALLFDTIDEVFDMIKLNSIHYSQVTENFSVEIENPNVKTKKSDIKYNYIEPNKNQGNSNNFKNIKISDDIEDYSNFVFSTFSTIKDKVITYADNNSATFHSFDVSLANNSGNDIAQFFSDNLVTFEFMYNNENQGFLQIAPNLSNLTFEEINSLKLKSMSNFYTEDLKSVLLISQNIDDFALNKVFDIDIDDLETVNLNEYAIRKGYPVYVSVYSNILSDNYSFSIALS